MAELVANSYRAAVRALCEFTAKSGDLDLRFTPAPTAQEGIAGHRVVASRRSADYQREVKLTGGYGELNLRGRADGFDPRPNRLEEVKTYRGDVHAIPQNHRDLHWAQLKIYGTLQCRTLNLTEIELALIYFNVDTQKETAIVEQYDCDTLEQFYAKHCDLFLTWAHQEQLHRQERDAALTQLQFPHASFRQGQRELAEAVYKSICTQQHLLAQATTGIGKTIGTIFPLLKAFATKGIDKGFFLTAKTTGRALALEALSQIRSASPQLPLRVLELIARDKACEYPDKSCHGESCPLARGFYDRLSDARKAAANMRWLDEKNIRAIASQHQICPYYLSIEMTRWADFIIGDYNYFFDTSALLYQLAVENEWRIGVLVDEAHNLIDRARSMYSASLRIADIEAAKKEAPAAIKRSLGKVLKQARELGDKTSSYASYDELPPHLLPILQNVLSKIGEHQQKSPTEVMPSLEHFFFDVSHFCNLAEVFEDHSLCDVEVSQRLNDKKDVTITLRNVIPAPFLKARFEATESSTLFSATLFPENYYRDLLGLPEKTAYLEVESPFTADQLEVRIAADISTRFKQRDASIKPIADLIAEQFARFPGNYIAYFSSFHYLDQVFSALLKRIPSEKLKRQLPKMDEAARREFLNSFTNESQQVGLAVLGGAFAEGIDLPGDRLIGAFVATLGLPQFNEVNEQFKHRMAQRFGSAASYDYAYFYPGLQKVVQAAGRVVRTQQDRGVLYLIDDRFSQITTQRLLPQWWQLRNHI